MCVCVCVCACCVVVGYFWRFADFLAVYNALNVVLFLLGFALTLNR